MKQIFPPKCDLRACSVILHRTARDTSKSCPQLTFGMHQNRVQNNQKTFSENKKKEKKKEKNTKCKQK
jgi:hypothetical protein